MPISKGIALFAGMAFFVFSQAVGSAQAGEPCKSDYLTGVFCPLSPGASSEIPVPRQGCGDQKPEAEAWEQGAKEALTGNHFLMNQRLRGKGKLTRQDVAKLRSTFATEKRGCNSYRGKPRSESGEELQCCIDGFYKGLEKLAQQVDQSFKKDSELAKSEDFGRCRTSYSAGDADGKIRCEYELPSEGGARNNCPKYSFDSVAYIGCYQIGFLRALEACGCPTARDEVASVKTRAPAIFAEKALGKPASLKIGNTTLYPVAEPANAQQAK